MEQSYQIAMAVSLTLVVVLLSLYQVLRLIFPFHSFSKKVILRVSFGGIVAIGILGTMLLPNFAIMDEHNYFPLITHILQKNWELDPTIYIAIIPGHAYLIAFFAKLFQVDSLYYLRFISFSISIPLIYFAYFISNRSGLKTLSLFLFPIILPYFFLIYSDTLALLGILAFYYFLKKNSTFLSICIGIATLSIRQDAILWLLFFSLSAFISQRQQKTKCNYKIFIPFVLSIFFFVIYLLFNRGVGLSVEDRIYHPIGIFLDNIIFFLFMHFIFFLPTHLCQSIKFIRMNKQRRLLFLALFIILTGTFFVVFRANHPFLFRAITAFPKSQYLDLVRNNLIHRLLFCLFSAYAALSIPLIPMIKKSDNLLYPFSLIFCSMHWFIEVRYYIIPFSLLILRRKEKILHYEFAWQLFWTVFIAFGLWNGVFYP